jgi:lysophospholipase L1-like esterase
MRQRRGRHRAPARLIVTAAMAALGCTPLATRWNSTPALPPPPPSVLCYGDSITQGALQGLPETSYPAQLQQLRPDLLVENGGRSGDTSASVERFRTLLAQRRYTFVVILIGTNDPLRDPKLSPRESLQNIWEMTRLGRDHGAEVIVLTPPPASCEACEARQAHTRELAHLLITRDVTGGHAHIHVADLRDQFTIRPWQDLSWDGLHPNTDGNRLIAAFVSAAIASVQGSPAIPGDACGRR